MKPHDLSGDWFIFLERKQALFLMGAFIKPWDDLLRKEIGVSSQKQLHINKSDSSYYIRSKAEHELIRDRLLSFILKPENQEAVKKWLEQGKEYNSWADKQINLYKKLPEEDINQKNFRTFLEKFQYLLLYSTIMPYLVLHVAEFILKTSKSETDKKRAEEVIQQFNILRGDTRYPQTIEGVVTKYWQYLSKTTGLPIETIQLLLPEEVEQALIDPSSVKQIEKLEERENCVFGILPGKEFFFDFSPESAKKLLPEQNTKVSSLSGSIANPGKVKGIVKIVNVIADIAKVEEKDIIVSINTSPSLMPALKKAAAFVTDEGGITCHAAIVSRELNKPCVIGTKIATKVFKDGDLIEVDANKGIVRKIK